MTTRQRGRPRGRPRGTPPKAVGAMGLDTVLPPKGLSPDTSSLDPKGAWVAHLDPRLIRWRQGYIESDYDDDRTAGLRASMADLGQEDAIGVYLMEDGSYEGSAGYHRCAEAIELGWPTVLCVVRRGSHKNAVLANIANSLNQSRPSAISEVEGVAHAVQTEGIDVADLAQASGKSVEWIEERLMVVQASPQVLEALRQGLNMGLGHAIALARVEDWEVQEKGVLQLLVHRWTVKELAAWIAKQFNPESGAGGSGPSTPRGRNPNACNICHQEKSPEEVNTLFVCSSCTELAERAQSFGGRTPELVRLIEDLADGLAASPDHDADLMARAREVLMAKEETA